MEVSMSTVIIYGKLSWPYTVKAREAFEAEGRSVDYRDVVQNPGLLDEMMKVSKGKRQVPVILDGEKVQIGFGGSWGVWFFPAGPGKIDLRSQISDLIN